MLECPYCGRDYTYVGIDGMSREKYICYKCRYIMQWNGLQIVAKYKY